MQENRERSKMLKERILVERYQNGEFRPSLLIEIWRSGDNKSWHVYVSGSPRKNVKTRLKAYEHAKQLISDYIFSLNGENTLKITHIGIDGIERCETS